jgi:hypothetical protein
MTGLSLATLNKYLKTTFNGVKYLIPAKLRKKIYN